MALPREGHCPARKGVQAPCPNVVHTTFALLPYLLCPCLTHGWALGRRSHVGNCSAKPQRGSAWGEKSWDLPAGSSWVWRHHLSSSVLWTHGTAGPEPSQV